MLVRGTTASGRQRNMRKNDAVVKCVPVGLRVLVEGLDLGHEAGEEDGCRTPGASGSGQLVSPRRGRLERAMDSNEEVQESSHHPD
jgi:hypothetical protein